MDLLDSIMSSMDKPPSLSEKERTILKSKSINLKNVNFSSFKLINHHAKLGLNPLDIRVDTVSAF